VGITQQSSHPVEGEGENRKENLKESAIGCFLGIYVKVMKVV